MASVLMHIETVNIKFLNDIVWSIEVGDNLEDRLDTKRKVNENLRILTFLSIPSPPGQDQDKKLELVYTTVQWL